MEKLLKDLSTCEEDLKRSELKKAQAEALSKAIDIALVIENQRLINELHSCLRATISLNDI